MNDLKARVRALSMDFPSRDAGSRGEELSSEALADDLYGLGLQTDIDGFTCPGNLRISRSIYMALLVLAATICLMMPGMRALGLALGIMGVVFSFLSYNGTDFLGSVLSRFESQNVIARYVPEGMPSGTRRTKVVVVAHYDVKKPSFFQHPAVRRYYRITRLVTMVAALVIPVCCFLCLLPFPEILCTIISVIAFIAGVVMILQIIDQLVGSFLKTPKGANCNASGLAVMLELAKKIVTADVKVPAEGSDDVVEEFGPESGEYGEYGYVEGDPRGAAGMGAYAGEPVAAGVAGAGGNIVTGLESVLEGWQGSSAEATVVPADAPADGAECAPADAPAAAQMDATDGPAAGAPAGGSAVMPEAAVMTEQSVAEQRVAPQPEAVQIPAAGAAPRPVVQATQDPSVDAAGAGYETRWGRVMPRAAGEIASATANAETAGGSAAAVAASAVAASAASEQTAKKASNKPSWWSKVEDDKKRGEFEHAHNEPTLRSRYADSPASRDYEEILEGGLSGESGSPAITVQPAQAQPAAVEQLQPAVQPQQVVQPQPAKQEPLFDDGVEPKEMLVSFDGQASSGVVAPPMDVEAQQIEAQQLQHSQRATGASAPAAPSVPAPPAAGPAAGGAEGVPAAPDAMPATKTGAANGAAAVATESADAPGEAAPAAPADAPAAAPASADANSTIAYTPRPIAEVLSDLDEGVMKMEQKPIERKAMPERPEPYQEPLVQPDDDSSASWPTGSYKYSRNLSKYRREDSGQPSYDALASNPETGVLDFSRERYETQINQRNMAMADAAAIEDAPAAADAPAIDAAPGTAMVMPAPAEHHDHRKVSVDDMPAAPANASMEEGRTSLLNLPIVGSKNLDANMSMAEGGMQRGLDTTIGGDDMFISRGDVGAFGAESGSTNLTGAFAPLGASGVMQPVTAEMLEQYNDGDSLYVDDAEDDYESGYSEQGSYVNEVEIDMPKRKLFGRKNKDKKSKKRGRKGEEQSANEWLGIDEGYNATREGAKIGSWDNFSDRPGENDDLGEMGRSVWDSWEDYDDEDSDWRGGAYGGDTPEQNRDAIDALSDELLNKEVWFVGLGASDAGSAGMENLLRTHAEELKHARIINLECIGSGKLCFTASEPILFKNHRVDPRMQKMVKRAAHNAGVAMDRIELDTRSTEATPAIAKKHRAITITAQEGGVVPGWKWGDDNDDIVSEGNLRAALRVLVEIVKAS